MVREIKDANDFEETVKKNTFVVVDFHAVWCGPCRFLAPILDDAEKEIAKALEAAPKPAADGNPTPTPPVTNETADVAKPDGGDKPAEEKPVVEKPAEEKPAEEPEKKEMKVAFIKVDVDVHQHLAVEYGVSAMPTILLFKNGELLKTIVGANIPVIKSAIEENTGVKLA